jgi:hypothetical protein
MLVARPRYPRRRQAYRLGMMDGLALALAELRLNEGPHELTEAGMKVYTSFYVEVCRLAGESAEALKGYMKQLPSRNRHLLPAPPTTHSTRPPPNIPAGFPHQHS